MLNYVRLAERALDSAFPSRLVDLPSKHDAFSAVFVVRLEHQLIAMLGEIWQEIDWRLARAWCPRRPLLDDACPGNVLLDCFPLLGGEERRIALVAQDGEARLL